MQIKKHCKILIAILLICYSTNAQYNKTYYSFLTGNPYRTMGMDIIDGGASTSVLLAQDNNVDVALGGSQMKSLNLKKVDFNGNLIFDVIDTLFGGMIIPKKVIKTLNDEYIVVGLTYFNETPNYFITCPFAARYDNNGVRLWSKYYPSSTINKAQFNGNLARIVSIERVFDDVDESYIIVCPADGDFTVNYDHDCLTNAFRIDANGNVIWNKKYGYSSANRFVRSNFYETIMDYPSTIRYGNDGHSGKYFIAGGRELAKFMVTDYMSYYLSIDKNGIIVDPYTIFDGPNYAYGYNAYFDDKSNRFLLTYTMGNNSLEPRPTVSQITVSQFDFVGLSHYSTDYYFNDSATENYAYYLTENLDRDAYIISCYHLVNAESTVVKDYSNTSILSVDQTTMAPKFYNRFNIEAVTYPVGHTTLFDPINGIENHSIFTHRRMPPTGSGYPYMSEITRVINTDINGDACGVAHDDIIHKVYSPFIALEPYNEFVLGTSSAGLPLTQVSLITEISDCDTAADPNFYRRSNGSLVLDSTASNILIYPTLLQFSDKVINVDLFSNSVGYIDITIVALDGRLVHSERASISLGSQKILLNVENLKSGFYILNLATKDNLMINTSKIYKL